MPSSPSSSAFPFVIVISIFVLVSCIVIGVGWAYWPMLDRAYAYEDAPLAWLQTSLLWSCGLLALVHGMLSAQKVFHAMALTLAFAALDERFMGHERLKEAILYGLFDGDVARMGWLGDAPMLAYAIGGAVMMFVLWRALAGGARLLAIAGILTGIVAIGIDILTMQTAWQVVEELLEILAETLLVCSLVANIPALGQPSQVQVTKA